MQGDSGARNGRHRSSPSGAPKGPSLSGTASEFLTALEGVTSGIPDPVAKLKFIRGSLARYEALGQRVQSIPVPPLRWALYRWLSLEGARHFIDTNAAGRRVNIDRRVQLSIVGARAAAVLIVVGLTTAALTAAWRLTRPPSEPVVAAAVTPPVVENTQRSSAGGAAHSSGLVPAGVAPAAVWLVEKGPGFEQYSNGLRIDTRYAVAGTTRSYRVFSRESGALSPERKQPVGLLFHTSESDVWPLEASFNESLRDSSQRLLRYVSRNKLYHYVIDRFGRVYRTVDEDSKANHAGFSVWGQGDDVYMNLNHAFLAVSFETRWEGGRALPITQAQFAAGRTLSDQLRQKYDLSPDLCVTHGLTSVNPKKHLIGHHMDWARGFPFEAFSLPNQYERQPASVAVFGFGYDDDFKKVMGEPWVGVKDAEASLAVEARNRGISTEDVRRERQGLYDLWLAEQSREDGSRGQGASLPEPDGTGSRTGDAGASAR